MRRGERRVAAADWLARTDWTIATFTVNTPRSAIGRRRTHAMIRINPRIQGATVRSFPE